MRDPVSSIARWALLGGSLAFALIACGASSPGSPSSAGDPAAGGAPQHSSSAGNAGAPISGAASAAGAPAVAGGSANSTGGADTQGSPGGAGNAGTDLLVAAGSAGVAPGTCGVAHRIPLPDVPSNFMLLNGVRTVPDEFIRRVAAGFTVGPWNTGSGTPAQWLQVDTNEKQTLYSTGYVGGAAATASMADPALLVLVDGGYQFGSRILDAGAAEPSLGSKLFDGQQTKFSWPGASASLDGQRGLFMEAEIAGHAPWLAAFAPDGTPVGDVLKSSDDGACYQLLPTEHGNAFSIMEGDTFHLREFSAAGVVVLDVKVPVVRATPPDQQTPCPLLALSATGFAFLAYEPSEASGDQWHLHRIARDGTPTVAPWPAITTQPRALAVTADTAIAVSYDGKIVQQAHGQDRTFQIERAGYQIHSEAGALFLDVRYFPSVEPASPRGALSREIVEVRCVE